MTETKVVLKPFQEMRIVIQNHPQLICAMRNEVQITINKYSDNSYNIVYTYEGLFTSLWCNEYSIKGGKDE